MPSHHHPIRSTCGKCNRKHTKNEERFHGEGSFIKTHGEFCSTFGRRRSHKTLCYKPKSKCFLRKGRKRKGKNCTKNGRKSLIFTSK